MKPHQARLLKQALAASKVRMLGHPARKKMQWHLEHHSDHHQGELEDLVVQATRYTNALRRIVCDPHENDG